MTASIHTLSTALTHYSVHISQDTVGIKCFTVSDVDDTEENRLRVAAALRIVADMLEDGVGQRSTD